MPLNTPGLQSSIQSLMDDPGASAAECAQSWASLIGSYAAGVIPASVSVAAAQTALQAALLSAFTSAPGAGAALFDAALTAFGAAVGTGMAPAFVAVPPPAPAGFATQAGASPPQDATAAVTVLASLIDTWMRTGTATPSVGGPPVIWT
jgi:hypothetical protein